MAKELNVDEESLRLEYVYVAQLMINGGIFETEKAKTLFETVKASPQVEKVEEAVIDFIAFVKDQLRSMQTYEWHVPHPAWKYVGW